MSHNLYNGTVPHLGKTTKTYVGSNHPRLIFKHIPNGIMVRLSTNSSNIDIFIQNENEYEAALKNQWL